MNCIICGSELKKGYYGENSYDCYTCKIEGLSIDGEVKDGYFYPEVRRNILCVYYTPAFNLKVNNCKIGQEISYLTSRKSVKKAKILHIWNKEERMIIQDESGKNKVLIDYGVIKEAYSCLHYDNKQKYRGWWNKKIEII